MFDRFWETSEKAGLRWENERTIWRFQEEERDAAEAQAKAKAWENVQLKSKEETKRRAAIALAAAELAAKNYRENGNFF